MRMELNYIIVLLALSIQMSWIYCDGGLMFSRHAGEKSWSDQYCIFYNPYFHTLPTQKQQGDVYKLVDLSSTYGCNASDFTSVSKSGDDVAVIVARGECPFSTKAYNAQNASAKAIIVASDELISPGASNATVDYKNINITVATALWDSVHAIQKTGPKVEVLLYSPEAELKFDPNIALIFAIAVSCVLIGGYWEGTIKYRKFLQLVEKHRRKKLELATAAADDEAKDEDEDDNTVDITLPAIIVFFLLVCTFIVLLYFFYDQLVYVIIGLFCLAGAMGMYSCLHPVWKRLVPLTAQFPRNKIPFLKDRPEYRDLVFGLMCLGVGIWWCVERHAPYSWILQDILGYMFCIHIMKSVSIPNLKICTVLLCLLFVYDIFFVFITPLLTSSGDSIMIKVATGGDSKTKETIPMAFRVPKLTPGVCPTQESLLGFGDIVIPGLLVCHNHAFDLKAGVRRRLYFIATAVAYAVGLLVTFGALFLMESGQPALLYIVPCTLSITFLIGCIRGEVKKLWTGAHDCPVSPDTNGEPSANQSARPAASIGNVSSDSGTDNESRGLISR